MRDEEDKEELDLIKTDSISSSVSMNHTHQCNIIRFFYI